MDKSFRPDVVSYLRNRTFKDKKHRDFLSLKIPMKTHFQTASGFAVLPVPMSFSKIQDFGSLGIPQKSVPDAFASPHIFGSPIH